MSGFRSKSAGENALRTLESAQTKARQTKPGLMHLANTMGGRLVYLSHPGTASFAHLRAYFDQEAKSWDAGWTAPQRKRLAEIVTNLNIRPEDRVLDVGCGTGVLFSVLRTERIVGVDISSQMLYRAQAKAPVHLVQADAHILPFGEIFDWVICNCVFPHFSQPARALGTIHRVLRPGGGLLICHVEACSSINAMHRDKGGAVADDLLPDSMTLRQMLDGAGFEKIRVQDRPDRYVARGWKRR